MFLMLFLLFWAGVLTIILGLQGKLGTTPSVESVTEQIQAASTFRAHEHILFVSDRTGNNEIYLMDLTTKRTWNLTDRKGEDMNPQLSPDRKSVVFYSNRDGDNEIYKLTLADNSVAQLTNNTIEDYDPSYSPDGNNIVYKSNRDDKLGDIFIMNEDGSDERNLTRSLKKSEEWDPTFNLDGEKIYFVMRENNDHLTDELYAMNIDGTEITRLTENSVPDWYPSISPDGKKLLITSRLDKDSSDSIWVISPDGSTRTKLTDMEGNNDDAAWDATGERIIFINDREKNYDMYIMNADGSNVVRIEQSSSDELSPIFITNTALVK